MLGNSFRGRLRLEPGRKFSASPRLAFMVLHFMPKSNKVVPKKGRGRPATGRDPVTAIRLSEKLRANVDSWAAAQDDQPGRSEAIRRLVEMGLHAGASAESVRAQTKASDYATQASELAEDLGLKVKSK
jgi:hypothetical protein